MARATHGMQPPEQLTTPALASTAQEILATIAYPKKNLGPWDGFEWGMIIGKLPALRWC